MALAQLHPEMAGVGRGEEGARSPVVRAMVWLLGVSLLTGFMVGLFVIGPAGRLAMRLIAATSPDAQGRLTEFEAVVGQVSPGGTLGVFVFVGLGFGRQRIAYALASFVLPRGAVGGAIFGAAVLVIFGSTVDPLREVNPDFDIVGPGWLSVTTFCAMSVLTGVLTAATAGRVAARWGPRIDGGWPGCCHSASSLRRRHLRRPLPRSRSSPSAA